MNNPVSFVDVDGKDVIVAFSGANFFSENSTATAGKIINSINSFVSEQGLKDVHTLAVSTNLWDTGDAIKQATSFINEHLGKDDKLVIYGYSKGGEAAMDLTRSLGSKKVDLLITIDAANGLNSKNMNRQIPANVLFNINWFQTAINWNGSKGDKNSATGSNTIIINKPVPNTSHTNIDEDTQERSVNEIKSTIKD